MLGIKKERGKSLGCIEVKKRKWGLWEDWKLVNELSKKMEGEERKINERIEREMVSVKERKKR